VVYVVQVPPGHQEATMRSPSRNLPVVLLTMVHMPAGRRHRVVGRAASSKDRKLGDTGRDALTTQVRLLKHFARTGGLQACTQAE